ncbi:dethiobiotin synthase [Gloeocapsa sp. PCC 73106]|uniref:dethiobiotin synthase n=1 Tax=Gloeocapsa sp. PCC 73106 TaxID=102232 RepID=UPI0002ACEE33|nr:dethiobiotin synthase [Gloeocapsa sp. PCC 73106]ELR99427.1 dethiobiotin synthase [Gloeocapsa sp. PCC 73106]
MTVLLIAGTDTNVGKTIVTTALVASWLQSYPKKNIGLMKLMQTGIGDRQFYEQLFNDTPQVEIVTPIEFDTPVAPPVAAEREKREIDLGLVWQSFSRLTQSKDLVVVEAIGGLGTPITHELTVADLARDWRLPTLLVVPVKLGAIAQAVANVMYARYAQVKLMGIILSCVGDDAEAQLEEWAPVDLITSLTQIPVLGTLPHLNNIQNLELLARSTQDWYLPFSK